MMAAPGFSGFLFLFFFTSDRPQEGNAMSDAEHNPYE